MASTDKSDLRITKTEAKIKQAFTKLIKEKDINNISIKELCETAGINKSTFYLHYHDMHDLTRHYDELLMAEIKNIIQEYNFDELITKSAQIARRLLNLFNSFLPVTHDQLYNQDFSYLLTNADKYIISALIDNIEKKEPNLSPEDLAARKINTVFIVNGFISLIKHYHASDISDECLNHLSDSLQNGLL